jgi:hypothetical protein
VWKRYAGQIRELSNHGILLCDDRSQRIDLLLECGVVLPEIIQTVSELNDLFADRDVCPGRRAGRARDRD